MKGAVISLAVMALITATVIVGAIFVTDSMTLLESSITAIEPEKFGWESTLVTLNAARATFDSRKTLLSLTVKDKEVAEIGGYLDELLALSKKENLEELTIAKSRLISALGEIRQLHEFGLKSVF